MTTKESDLGLLRGWGLVVAFAILALAAPQAPAETVVWYTNVYTSLSATLHPVTVTEGQSLRYTCSSVGGGGAALDLSGQFVRWRVKALADGYVYFTADATMLDATGGVFRMSRTITAPGAGTGYRLEAERYDLTTTQSYGLVALDNFTVLESDPPCPDMTVGAVSSTVNITNIVNNTYYYDGGVVSNVVETGSGLNSWDESTGTLTINTSATSSVAGGGLVSNVVTTAGTNFWDGDTGTLWLNTNPPTSGSGSALALYSGTNLMTAAGTGLVFSSSFTVTAAGEISLRTLPYSIGTNVLTIACAGPTTQVWTVPAGITNILVKLGGGGGGAAAGNTSALRGGDGGLSWRFFDDVLPGENFVFAIAEGGVCWIHDNRAASNGAYYGGGKAIVQYSFPDRKATGGGASLLWRVNLSSVTTLVMAAGGGGAQAYYGFGGDGGGTAGQWYTTDTVQYGRGGTQSAGGLGGSRVAGEPPNAPSGSYLQGADILYTNGSTTGGGGYYGGGAGSYESSGYPSGGGSGWVDNWFKGGTAKGGAAGDYHLPAGTGLGGTGSSAILSRGTPGAAAIIW